MGYNIAGLLMKGHIDQIQIETVLEQKIVFLADTDFEDATGSLRDKTVDLLQTSKGLLLLTELGVMYDISEFDGEIIQFMISDVSETYYFEKYTQGNLDRKYISSQGGMIENQGSGIINADDEMIEVIWKLTGDFLQNNFTENRFDFKFKRYRLV